MTAIALEGDVRSAQHGDHAAFARLVDACRGVVCAITLAILRDVPASEDVAQEVFVAAWQSVGKLRNPQSFLPWLRQLTRNHAHASLRGKIRYRRRNGAWNDADALGVADAALDASRLIIDEEERIALAAAIEELPDDAREIVTLFYREGGSTRQVAELLGLGEDAVKKRLERARASLRAAMLERFAVVVRRTAPGASFTAAVAAAIVVASPATATAAGLGFAKAAGSGAKAVGLGAAGGALIGGGTAIAAIAVARWRLSSLARDDEERRDIRRFFRVNVAFIAVTFGVWWLWVTANHGQRVLFPPLAFVVGMGFAYGVWLPRIIARRQALERLEDPKAEARQRRERILGLTGTILGMICGIAGIIVGMYQ